jgi:hypothetical protein
MSVLLDQVVKCLVQAQFVMYSLNSQVALNMWISTSRAIHAAPPGLEFTTHKN